MFQAKLPFQHIIFFSDTNQQTLIDKLNLEVKEVNYRKMTVEVSPVETYLFLIKHGKHIYFVSEENIDCIEDFCYRLGILSNKTEDIHEELRKAEWSLCEDGLICKVQHTSEKDVKYYALGWFETLPEKVIEKAKNNKWMMNVLSFREAKEMLQDSKEKISFYSEMYSGDGHLPACLSSIPVSFHSVSQDKVREEEIECVDVLQLRNLENFYELTRLEWGTDRMLRTPLDIFDAMVSLQLAWKVDRKNELIYLPCIPSSKNRSGTVYTTTQSSESKKDHTNVLDFYNKSNTSVQKELLQTMFPYLSEKRLHSINVTLVEKEFARRLGLYGKKLIAYGFGQLNMYCDKVFCTFPPSFA